jgi:hypothetical protein
MGGVLTEEVLQRLREAGAEELRQLVMGLLAELDVPAAEIVLRNPHAGEEVLRLLAAERRLLAFYDLRRELALHARSPQPLALSLLSGLYWRDLVAAGLDVKIRPVVRRAAEQRLVERLPAMAVGEKVAIARRASRPVLQALRNDLSPQVVAALLDNPRLTESDLLPLAAAETARPQTLEALATHRKWGSLYALRAAVVRNPAAPLALATRLLPLLKKGDQRAVASDPRLHNAVRRRAQVLLGEAE